MTNKLYQSVGKSKKAMIEFLINHFRYNTMNSWNRSTSYANNVKIQNVISPELQSKVYSLMECEGFYEELNWILEDFALEHNHQWQAGFNGRSGGYIVLYEGIVEFKTIFSFSDGNDRDFADGYGWKSMEEAKKQGLYKKQIKKIGTYPGRAIDMGEDFSDWDIVSLKARVKLVQSFDKMCDAVINQIIQMAKNNSVKEEEYTVVKTKKVMV